MKRRLIPTEVRLVESILMEPEEDATVTAVNILRAINEKRDKETIRVALLFDKETRQFLSAHGPYGSLKAAQADLDKGGVVTRRPCFARIAVLVNSDTQDTETGEEHAQ